MTSAALGRETRILPHQNVCGPKRTPIGLIDRRAGASGAGHSSCWVHAVPLFVVA